jgi:hypothetical protein
MFITCSRQCQVSVYNARGRARKRRRRSLNTCAVCQLEFTSARRDARFCSDACRQWAYRARRLPGKAQARPAGPD